MKIDLNKVKVRPLLRKDAKKFINIIERHTGYRYSDALEYVKREKDSNVLGGLL